jgi:WD40 repeat protein
VGIKTSSKKRIVREFFVFVLFVLSIVACSQSTTKTPRPSTSTAPPESTSYQFVLEKSLGYGIAEAADWAPDGSSFALATSVQVELYDAQTLEIMATLDTGQWNNVIAYSPDSKFLAMGGKDGAVQIWDIASRKLVHKLIPNGKPVLYGRDVMLAFRADSQQLVSSLYHTIYLWDLRTGTLIDSFPGYPDEIQSVAIWMTLLTS